MESCVIVVTSGKGGVGKTTTTANLAVALAGMGSKVVAIDGDVGLRNLDVIMGLENRIVYTLIDALDGLCRLNQTLIRDKRMENLYMIPTAQSKTKDAVTSEQMKEICDELRKDFDYVLVDSPAGIEAGFRNAAAGADQALVVTTPEVSAVRDADRIIGLLESMGKSPIRLIVNRIRPQMMKKGDMLSVSDVLDVLAIDLIGMVPDDESVVTSSNKGEPLTLSSDSPASRAFRNIASRIAGVATPFQDLDVLDGSGGSLFGRIKRAFFGH
ncbi:MAG: septum site-determining protein MinD [Synergistaceae bacterium]|jgi:septum site-determining protein MinD|nr:septum site-determining protein MinD [Synergistaceae bacterium]